VSRRFAWARRARSQADEAHGTTLRLPRRRGHSRGASPHGASSRPTTLEGLAALNRAENPANNQSRAGPDVTLPNLHDLPPGVREVGFNPATSIGIVPHLVRPKCRVRGGSNVVLRASVPETTVHENGNLGPPMTYVRATWKATVMQAISHACGPEFLPQGKLWRRVLRPHSCHAAMRRVVWCVQWNLPLRLRNQSTEA
jgi:hypothetical protein